MMNRRFLHPAIVFFLLTLLVAFLSWVGSIYGWHDVQSLLSSEGLRWQLRNAVPGFLKAPFLGHLLILAFGIGLWMHSGLGALIMRLFMRHSRLSGKEKRAFCWSLVVGGIFLAGCMLLAWGPWNLVRSITGGLEHSPLAEGCTFLVSVGVGTMALVYGYAVDYYHTDRDLVRGLSYAFVRFSGFFITLFFMVQFFASLRYTGLDVFMGLSPSAFHLCYVIGLFLTLFLSRTTNE